MKFEVFNIGSFDKWENILNFIPNKFKDIYYTPAYYQTWMEYENAQPMCIYAEKSGIKFLYPFFKKEISGYNTAKKYFDIQSAYGYGGVIANTENPPLDFIQEFNENIDNWCLEENIIAEFIRENPLLRNKEYYIRNANYSLVRNNVYTDFSINYLLTNKSALRNIKKAKNYGLTIEVDNELNTLNEFQYLYNLTYERLKMDTFYKFSKDYFYSIENLLKDNTKLINIFYKNQIIASALLFVYGKKATYHLGASNFEFSKFYPNDLLFYAMLEYSMTNEVNFLSYGGGTTNDANDSLLRYKRKFGNYEREVYVGKKIHNIEIYRKLCEEWEKSVSTEIKDKFKNFFLKYRIGIKYK